MKLLVAAAAFACSATAAGCLFMPDVAQYGYLSCDSDAACPPGRYCDEAVCAPPPWHDQAFGTRRAIIIENPAASAIPAGAAVPLLIGDESTALPLLELGADFRFADYDRSSAQWRDVAVHLDRQSDRFTAWIPVAREIAAGASDVLAFIENHSEDGLPHVAEDAATVFANFDGFDAPLAGWFESPQGGPFVQDGMVNVADNQAILLQTPLVPPVLAVLVARVNGASCDEVFLGLIGDDRSLFEVPPEAGLFVGNNLSSVARVAPTPDSTPTDVGDGLTIGNAMTRTVIAVDGGGVSIEHGGAVAFADPDLRPPFGADPLYLAVQVGGACSVDVDAVWTTPLPQPLPRITVQAPVDFNLAFQN